MSYPQMRRTGFLDDRRVIRPVTRSHGNLIAARAGVPGVQMRISPGVGAHNSGLAIDFQPGPPWPSAHVVLRRIFQVIYDNWNHLGVRYMAWDGYEYGGSNPVRTNKRRQRWEPWHNQASDPYHRNHLHVDFRPGATVRSSLPGGYTPAGGSNSSSSSNTPSGGNTVSAPTRRQIWNTKALRDFVNGDKNANSYGFMISRIHQYVNALRSTASDVWGVQASRDFVNGDENANSYGFMLSRIHQYVNGLRSTAADVWARQASRDFVNGDDKANSYGFMLSRIHQYVHGLRNTRKNVLEVRSEVRELKAMVKAMAEAQDANTGKILDAVEYAERESIQINAAQVVKELSDALENDDQEEG